MRNATQADVDLAKQSGKLQENVMYKVECVSTGNAIVHGKKQTAVVEAVIRSCNMLADHIILVETSDGILRTVNLDFLLPISTGVQATPKKPKRQPIKGTKPWPKYDPCTIKVGDKVRLRSGDITSVGCVAGCDLQVGGHWYKRKSTGRFQCRGKHSLDIVGMYQEPAPVYYTHENMPVGKVCKFAYIDGKSRLYRPHINVWYALHPEDKEPHYGIMHYCDTGDLILADE